MLGRLNEDILQEALDILHFPSYDNDSIRHHLAQVGSQMLPFESELRSQEPYPHLHLHRRMIS